jgi:hypothetical protein
VTEEIPATPGWVDERLDELFADLPEKTREARDTYAKCLAARKNPSEPSDLLGAEFEPCHAALLRALLAAGVQQQALAQLQPELEALEDEIDGES